MNNDTIPYGSYNYGSDGYKGGEEDIDRLHYYALKKAWPLPDMTGELDNHFEIIGHQFDNIYFRGNDLENEIFPDTAIELLGNYEQEYDTTNAGSIAARQANIVAHERVLVNKSGRMTPQYYVNIAAGLGYDSTVVEHAGDMFIVASTEPPATPLTHALWESSHRWTWDLDSTGSTVPADRTNLMDVITKAAPAFTKVNFFFV